MRKSKLVVYIIIILILITVFIVSRKIFFQHILTKLIVKTEKRFDWDINYKKANLLGIRTVYFTDLSVCTGQGTQIIHSDTIAFTIKPFALLFGNIRFKNLSIYNTQATISNALIKSLIHKKDSANTSDTTSTTINYTLLFNRLYTTIFKNLPQNITLRNTSCTYKNDSIEGTVTFENFIYGNYKFIGDIFLFDKTTKNKCFLNGELNQINNSFSCKISPSGTNNVQLPYIDPRWQLSIGFDTLQLSFYLNPINNNMTSLIGNTNINRLAIFHKQIGPDTVVADSGKFQFRFNIGRRSLELDSCSVLQMNKFSFSPYFMVKKDTSIKLAIAFIYKEFEADNLFSSFPKGLFINFAGLKTKGKLAYQMKAEIDFNDPDSVKFDSKLTNLNFSIEKYGETDFRKMNSSFLHEVYERDRLAASFVIGPDNPDFDSLGVISSYLKYSVLTSEDGDFYYHKGFNENAFRESIAKNIKEKRFARGGSTITMQLVKNVFLSRKKTISRKVEEALIVWIIENMHLTRKERMFEVYLNIIEWGPGIYGIKPAAKFYFNKTPDKLNLSESIYLTSLIPRPKGFKYTFDKEGKVRDYLIPYYQLLSGIMVRRNQILPEDTIGLKPISKLKGEARKFLASSDSTSIEDSIFFLQPTNLIPWDLNE